VCAQFIEAPLDGGQVEALAGLLAVLEHIERQALLGQARAAHDAIMPS
jgi:hypothetical protein